MHIDPYILAFSLVTVAVTVWMGFRSAKKSKTASDFFVAGRSVSVGWNASAISGEYLSAASFMGIAGMVMSSGYDALWYPVCYACGYLFLLLFIAGPLRRFGAYTIPDFAEGRFDSPVFRKIAVVFVLFIGFFYTMPQMKGAGTTLSYIFQDLDFRETAFTFLAPHGEKGEALKGLNYAVGVLVVGAVITLNVALGGMKGITLVQAFQYWAKMFAISVPIFVLMAVYGHYGKQVGANAERPTFNFQLSTNTSGALDVGSSKLDVGRSPLPAKVSRLLFEPTAHPERFEEWPLDIAWAGLASKIDATKRLITGGPANGLPEKAFYGVIVTTPKQMVGWYGEELRRDRFKVRKLELKLYVAKEIAEATEQSVWRLGGEMTPAQAVTNMAQVLAERGILITEISPHAVLVFPATNALTYGVVLSESAIERLPLPAKAPRDETWLNPFGPLTTKAAKTAAAAIGKREMSREAAKGAKENTSPPFATFAPSRDNLPLRAGLDPAQRMTLALDSLSVTQALGVYAELTGRQLLPNTNSLATRADHLLGGKLSALKLITRPPAPDSGVREHGDGRFTAAEVKEAIETHLSTNGLALVAVGEKGFRVVAAEVTRLTSNGKDQSLLTSAATAEKAWLAKHEKPLALLYTYSLIIAIVCGTAGLPHILVRFYTNPDGAAAKRTTMWVMILIGVFYVFPPVFGVIGRNLMPDLYTGLTGIKGTDQVVLKLPMLLNQKVPYLGSILSGITCAGAFAAFMSTFSGLLVSMTGALAHDVYGRILRPKSTPAERMRMFKWCAVLLGGVAILLGSMVEPLEINFMVGQAFAIAAASYFPLLFMAVWWRKLTMKGAAIGMLAGGTCALIAVALTNGSNLALDKGPMGKVFAAFAPLNGYWAEHPLLRILCEQPAIWAVPLAITLMVIVSKLTARSVPADIRMKMLVLHAPEELGLKQEYIQEHQQGPGH